MKRGNSNPAGREGSQWSSRAFRRPWRTLEAQPRQKEGSADGKAKKL